MSKIYDVAVIGAGLYGRYATNYLLSSDINLAVINIARDFSTEFRASSTGVASLVNQARIHNGYHYPRSFTTAQHSVKNYQRFVDDFAPAVIDDFKQIYAIPRFNSLTSSLQFKMFCDKLGVKCDYMIDSDLDSQYVDSAWLTDEKAIDTQQMMQIVDETFIKGDMLKSEISSIEKIDDIWHIVTDTETISARAIVNCSYAGINVIESLAGFGGTLTPVVYEACEIALLKPKQVMERKGFTFMDGPFISMMPFTKDVWSLTSVIETPHFSSDKPIDDVTQLKSHARDMLQHLKLFTSAEFVDKFEYVGSEFVVKTISKLADKDDSRLVTANWQSESFVSILSGKLNAVYDIQQELDQLKEVLAK